MALIFAPGVSWRTCRSRRERTTSFLCRLLHPCLAGVLGHHRFAISDQVALGCEGAGDDERGVGAQFEQDQLPPPQRLEPRRHCRSSGPFGRGLEPRGAGAPEAHVGQEQLLAVLVSGHQVRGPARFLGHASLLEAQPAGKGFAHSGMAAAMLAIAEGVMGRATTGSSSRGSYRPGIPPTPGTPGTSPCTTAHPGGSPRRGPH